MARVRHVRSANGLQYFLTDHLGSTVAVTDASGTLTSQQRYLPFGGVRTNVASPNSQSLITDLSYTGQRALDPGMGGLMDYKARFYSPLLGRFTQPDTLTPGGPQGLNRYSYVGNNPINLNDPTGHYACGDGEAKECGTGKKQDPKVDPYKPPKKDDDKKDKKDKGDKDDALSSLGSDKPLYSPTQIYEPDRGLCPDDWAECIYAGSMDINELTLAYKMYNGYANFMAVITAIAAVAAFVPGPQQPFAVGVGIIAAYESSQTYPIAGFFQDAATQVSNDEFHQAIIALTKSKDGTYGLQYAGGSPIPTDVYSLVGLLTLESTLRAGQENQMLQYDR